MASSGSDSAAITADVASAASSGPGWTFWAILLSVAVALLSIAAQRAVAKRRAAIDLILVSETEQFRTQRASLGDTVRNNQMLTLMEPKSAEDFQRRKDVSNVMNHYELIAISIFNRTVDDQIMKQYEYTVLVGTWEDCKDLAKAIGDSGQKTAYGNFKKLAELWIDDPEIETGLWRKAKSITREIIPW